MLSVEVEATSANVCVGFDVLGISLSMTNRFTFEKQAEFGFHGFDAEFCTKENNMVYDAYKTVFEKAGVPLVPVEIGFEGDIPVSRGLGSSSSLIVAGVFAANYYLGNRYTKRELFDICANLEGHPDNVAPAIYGGLVASYQKDGMYHPNLYKISDKLKFSVIIPPVKVSTHEARGVLPKELPYKDIVYNLSRIVNIPRAFENGDVLMLKDLFDDKLHEPYRGKLIPGYSEIRELLKDEECAFAISGSGSTMIVVSYDTKMLGKLSKFGYEIKTLTVGHGVKMEEI